MKEHLENLNRQAGSRRHWSAVRYSSALLHQMVDRYSFQICEYDILEIKYKNKLLSFYRKPILFYSSISPYVAHLLVNRKQVTVGTIGGDYELFSRQPGPTEVEEAIYSKVIWP